MWRWISTLLLFACSAEAELQNPTRPTNFPLSIPSVDTNFTGRVVVWPNESYGPTSDLGSDNLKISTHPDGAHVLVLKANGTVLAFGLNGEGQCNVPGGLTNVVDIAAGQNHSLALKSDGKVVHWGLVYGPSVPASLSNVVAIAGGYRHSLALKSDGSVVGWGGTGSVPPSDATNVVKIFAHDNYSLAIRSDGTVVGWGDITNSSYGWGPIPAGISNAVGLSGSGSRAFVLRGDGTVVSWGKVPNNSLSVIPSISNSVQIAGYLYSLRKNHNVDFWSSSGGVSDVPANLGRVIQISSGYNRVALVQDGVGLTVIYDSSKGSVTQTPYQLLYSNGQSVSVNAIPSIGYSFLNWTGAQATTNNPLTLIINGDSTITANFQPDLADNDSDGLSNYSEVVTHNSNPNKFSTTEDSISDGRKVELGYSPLLNLGPFILSLKSNPVSGLYNQSQYEANRTNGQSDILSNPNASGLYTTNQIHNLGLGGIVLNRDTNNQLTLNYEVMQSTDLQNWSPYQTYQLPITNAPTNKMFLRVQAVGQ